MLSTLNALWPLQNTLQDLRIEISDYSGAMPEPLQEKAFESFSKLKAIAHATGDAYAILVGRSLLSSTI